MTVTSVDAINGHRYQTFPVSPGVSSPDRTQILQTPTHTDTFGTSMTRTVRPRSVNPLALCNASESGLEFTIQKHDDALLFSLASR